MDRSDYEQRRAALEEIYRADQELVRAAHEARVRSLEALWLSASPQPAAHPAPQAAPAPAPVAAAPAPRVRNPDLRTALEEVLPQLPAVFDKEDIGRALGWAPSRGSLYRVLLQLSIEGRVETEEYSRGRMLTRYRKVGPSPPAD